MLLAALLSGIFLLPNLWQIKFQPTVAWAIVLSVLLSVCVLRFDSASPFLYFQF
jgi:hypothetical protein